MDAAQSSRSGDVLNSTMLVVSMLLNFQNSGCGVVRRHSAVASLSASPQATPLPSCRPNDVFAPSSAALFNQKHMNCGVWDILSHSCMRHRSDVLQPKQNV